ncbi:unnamed protein product [Amoebophrya sp. A120]|nr:unnamed protein product [Amoebophrya sp. A120]|eukprot:GSA120T00015129001.1
MRCILPVGGARCPPARSATFSTPTSTCSSSANPFLFRQRFAVPFVKNKKKNEGGTGKKESALCAYVDDRAAAEADLVATRKLPKERTAPAAAAAAGERSQIDAHERGRETPRPPARPKSRTRLHVEFLHTQGSALSEGRWRFAADRALRLLPEASATEIVDLVTGFAAHGYRDPQFLFQASQALRNCLGFKSEFLDEFAEDQEEVDSCIIRQHLDLEEKFDLDDHNSTEHSSCNVTTTSSVAVAVVPDGKYRPRRAPFREAMRCSVTLQDVECDRFDVTTQNDGATPAQTFSRRSCIRKHCAGATDFGGGATSRTSSGLSISDLGKFINSLRVLKMKNTLALSLVPEKYLQSPLQTSNAGRRKFCDPTSTSDDIHQELNIVQIRGIDTETSPEARLRAAVRSYMQFLKAEAT